MIRENIIKILKNQHVEIETLLHEIDNHIEKAGILDADYVSDELNKFKKILINHIAIEDEEFYPALLKNMNDLNENSDEIKDFIDRMDVIMKYVKAFLEQYNASEKIKNEHKDSFRAAFIRMMSRLEVRINVEELFVYNKWLKLKSLQD